MGKWNLLLTSSRPCGGSETNYHKLILDHKKNEINLTPGGGSETCISAASLRGRSSED